MRIILTISVKLWQILNTDVWFIIITIRISLKVGIEKSIVLAALKIGQIYRQDPHRVQLLKLSQTLNSKKFEIHQNSEKNLVKNHFVAGCLNHNNNALIEKVHLNR